jgi:putative ABC transport system permease protein
MDAWSVALITLALAAAGLVAVQAVRHPILARMAVRNVLRRPKQTATVVAGLMIGTAIISSALVAGDSARGAIRGYVYQSLGHVDESVAIQGYPYFPQAAYDALRADPEVQAAFDGVAAHAIWQGALEELEGGRHEPNVAVIGYDPGPDAAFGSYVLEDGTGLDGRSLAAGEAIATAPVARALGVGPGDRVRLSYVLPVDPLLPRLTFLAGNLTGTAVGIPGLPATPAAGTQDHAVEVGPGATRFTVAVAWDPRPAPGLPPVAELTVAVRDPAGSLSSTTRSAPPLVLNVTAPPGQVLPAGAWQVQLSVRAGASVAYRGVAVALHPAYDMALLQERARALRSELGPAADLLPGLGPDTERRTAEFTIAAVAHGGRGDLFDFREALFVRLEEAQALWGREGQVNLVKLSNPGGVEEGEAGTDAAMRVLEAKLADLRARHPHDAAVQGLEAKPLKREFLAAADAKGQTLTGMLVFAGSLSIVTGLLLILNIFTMLAEERRSELGMARAVGLGRLDLVRLSLLEGSVYAVAAAAIGSLLGLGLAYGMIQVMNAVVANLAADLSFPPIGFAPSWTALLLAFSTGALLTFATIAGASWRASRLNVVRAIRRLEEPEQVGSRVASLAIGLPLAGLGLAVALLGWLPNPVVRALLPEYALSLQMAGPLVLALGLGVALRPFVRRHLLVPLLAGALGLYYTATYFLITRYDNATEANLVGPLRGLVLTLCVVVLVVHWERAIRWLAAGVARLPGMRAVAVPAMAYPLHRKFRTGMTLAMFSVVILSIGFFSIFGALFETDPERQTGGFDVEARTTLGVPDLARHDRGEVPAGTVQGVVRLVEYRSEDRGFITVEGEQTGTFRDYHHVVYGYGADFVAAQRFGLTERLPEFASDREVYDAVLARDDLVLVSYIYSTDAAGQSFAHRAGDTLEMHLGETVRTYTIAGIQEQYHFPGIFLPQQEVDALFPGSGHLYLYHLREGADAEAAAQALESNYRDVGMDARSTVAQVLDEQASFRQVLGAMKLFLGLGLLVGVLSLGIITSRSVLERRQEIGMLRALGYSGRQVRRIFFTEVTTTVLLGAVVGIACAILVTYGLWFAVIRDLNYPYLIPWGEVAAVVGVSYVVAMLATLLPIGRSARVPPAEALRYLE